MNKKMLGTEVLMAAKKTLNNEGLQFGLGKKKAKL